MMGPQIDIWSLAVTIIELLDGKLPFGDEKDIMTKEPALVRAPISQRFHNLLMLMLQKEPGLRPLPEHIITFKEIIPYRAALSEEKMRALFLKP